MEMYILPVFPHNNHTTHDMEAEGYKDSKLR